MELRSAQQRPRRRQRRDIGWRFTVADAGPHRQRRGTRRPSRHQGSNAARTRGHENGARAHRAIRRNGGRTCSGGGRPGRRERDARADRRMRLRSLLFVPGDRPDQMQKALGAEADALILDLEDSVALPSKDQARVHVASFLRRDSRPLPLFVRINPLHSGLTDLDLAAVLDAAPDGLMLPKAEGAESIVELERRMSTMGKSAPRILPIATESPAAIFRLGEYARVADRLAGLTWGAEDLSSA